MGELWCNEKKEKIEGVLKNQSLGATPSPLAPPPGPKTQVGMPPPEVAVRGCPRRLGRAFYLLKRLFAHIRGRRDPLKLWKGDLPAGCTRLGAG